MEIEKLIETLRQRGVAYVRAYGRHCSICDEVATALSTLQAENSQLRESRDHWKRLAHELSEGVNGKDDEHERLRAENEKLRAELEQVKRALAMMWYAYDNKDGEFPHEYEIEAMQEAENVLGPWAECMPKYLQRGPEKED